MKNNEDLQALTQLREKYRCNGRKWMQRNKKAKLNMKQSKNKSKIEPIRLTNWTRNSKIRSSNMKELL